LILSETIALYHHEWWNGKGYPHGLAGEAIPLEARIVSVADAFDALTSKRVYKPSFTLDKALSILEEEKGTHFDPKIVDAFGEILPQIREILAQYNPECLAST
jgi:HD-GYP domain-containing protein (c-di-GMP phosphodiesterase class II)